MSAMAIAVVLELDPVHVGDGGVVLDHEDMRRGSTTGQLPAGHDASVERAGGHESGMAWKPEKECRGRVD